MLFQNACSTVPLMYIAIKYQHAIDSPFRAKPRGTIGKIIEDTKARPVRPMGVVRAAGRMTGHAVDQRLTCRQQRTIDRQKGTVGQCSAP